MDYKQKNKRKGYMCMHIKNKKVIEACDKLDKLDPLHLYYGYYLTKCNTRPDLSAKKYHLYLQVVNGIGDVIGQPVAHFDTITEFLKYTDERIKTNK